MGRGAVRRGIAALAASLCAMTGVCATNTDTAPKEYYAAKEEGWFWRQLEELLPELEETPLPDAASPVNPALTPLRPLSPAWLREKLPEFRDRALENPSTENVSAYFYLQRYAMDVAERFAQSAQRVVLADPSLDENVRRPISTYGGQVFDEVARAETAKLATSIAAQVGVWYFYRSDCPYCQAQNPVLERLQRRIGLTVLPIALDGQAMPEAHFAQFVPDRGHAQHLGVTQTPTLYLVKLPDQFVLLSEGLLTDEALMDRIVLAAHEAGWISDEAFNATRPRKPVQPSPDPTLLTDQALTDPVKLVELLRAHAGASQSTSQGTPP